LTNPLPQVVLTPIPLSHQIKMTHGKTVESADWSKDGRALYVFSANHRSVSLWQLVD
jgi:hypothetical protein